MKIASHLEGTAINSVTELRHELSDVFSQLKIKKLDHKDAAQFANIAGKMLASAKIQLEYKVVTKSKAAIPFLK